MQKRVPVVRLALSHRLCVCLLGLFAVLVAQQRTAVVFVRCDDLPGEEDDYDGSYGYPAPVDSPNYNAGAFADFADDASASVSVRARRKKNGRNKNNGKIKNMRGKRRKQFPQNNPTWAKKFQPRVTKVEKGRATKMLGSISNPEGSVWCQGRPMVWLTGHHNGDRPWCQKKNGSFVASKTTVLDYTDSKNHKDGPRDGIDRHDCATMDINQDGLEDVVCFVGADRGKGNGFSELYLTSPDGSLSKVLNHGLQKYPSTRTRFAVSLRSADGSRLVFISSNGYPRTDGK